MSSLPVLKETFVSYLPKTFAEEMKQSYIPNQITDSNIANDTYYFDKELNELKTLISTLSSTSSNNDEPNKAEIYQKILETINSSSGTSKIVDDSITMGFNLSKLPFTNSTAAVCGNSPEYIDPYVDFSDFYAAINSDLNQKTLTTNGLITSSNDITLSSARQLFSSSEYDGEYSTEGSSSSDSNTSEIVENTEPDPKVTIRRNTSKNKKTKQHCMLKETKTNFYHGKDSSNSSSIDNLKAKLDKDYSLDMCCGSVLGQEDSGKSTSKHMRTEMLTKLKSIKNVLNLPFF